MTWVWSDYSGNGEAPSLPLFLSERSQALLLAAIKAMQCDYAWDTDDYDETDAAISEAIFELMSAVMPDFTPVGAIVAWWSDTPPDKWMVCNGAMLDSDDYPELAAIIGDTGGLTVLPDFSDRFLFGSGTTTDVRDLGGENYHVLTIDEIPAHSHVQRVQQSGGAIVAMGNSTARTSTIAASTPSTGETGGGAAHNNMPEYVSVNWIIKVLP